MSGGESGFAICEFTRALRRLGVITELQEWALDDELYRYWGV